VMQARRKQVFRASVRSDEDHEPPPRRKGKSFLFRRGSPLPACQKVSDAMFAGGHSEMCQKDCPQRAVNACPRLNSDQLPMYRNYNNLMSFQ
jgi:hypothetical protein